jgi:hypothetical protein
VLNLNGNWGRGGAAGDVVVGLAVVEAVADGLLKPGDRVGESRR